MGISKKSQHPCFVVVQFMLCLCVGSGTLNLQHFGIPNICRNSQPKEEYIFERHTVRSLVTCASICNAVEKCLSFTYDNNQCNLFSIIIIPDCSTATTKTKKHFYEKSGCFNGGIEQQDGTCLCQDGYMDIKCYRLMTDCTDGMSEPSYAGGVHVLSIQPHSDVEPFQVACVMKWGGRTYVLYQVSASTNLTRGWQEYKNGFGPPKVDHWLGLDKIHHILRYKSMKLVFETTALIVDLSNQFQQTYSSFQIANETEEYRITSVGSKTGPLVDCMTDLIGAPFATYDHGTPTGRACASSFGGGWWFKSHCANCNPVGYIPSTADGLRLNVTEEKFWTSEQWSPRRIKVWLQ